MNTPTTPREGDSVNTSFGLEDLDEKDIAIEAASLSREHFQEVQLEECAFAPQNARTLVSASTQVQELVAAQDRLLFLQDQGQACDVEEAQRCFDQVEQFCGLVSRFCAQCLREYVGPLLRGQVTTRYFVEAALQGKFGDDKFLISRTREQLLLNAQRIARSAHFSRGKVKK